MNYDNLLPQFLLEVKEYLARNGKKVERNFIPTYRVTRNSCPQYNDFLSQQEENKNKGGKQNYKAYGCSVFHGEEGKIGLLKIVKNWQNCYIAVGSVNIDTGMYIKNESTQHINWWIFRDYKNTIHKNYITVDTVENLLKEEEEQHD